MGDFLASELLGSIVEVAESAGGSAAPAFIKKDVKSSFKINSEELLKATLNVCKIYIVNDAMDQIFCARHSCH